LPFEYSEPQKRAIQHRGSHLQILACAGSGKTETISRRCAAILAEGVDPEKIVAFTFTERAAAALKTRINRHVAELMGQEALHRLNNLFVGTIHSYCYRLLQQYVPKYAGYEALNEHQTVALVSREYDRLALSELGQEGYWKTIHVFLDNVELVENELIDTGKLKGKFASSYGKFRQMLQSYRALTFGQMIMLAVEYLQGADRREKPLKHLIVDEYQDINPAQEKLIELLAAGSVELAVVGDDLQSIYQWRGSNVENILTFDKRYPNVHRETLTVNRRSRPKIISVADSFSKTIPNRIEKPMKPSRPAREPEVVCWSAETPFAEANIVGDTILDLVKNGFRYSDCSVLLRSARTSAEPYIAAFNNRHIPFRCIGRSGLFLQPEPQLFARTYAWLGNGFWQDPFSKVREEPTLQNLLQGYSTVFEYTAGLKSFLNDWKTGISDELEGNLVGDFYALLEFLNVREWDSREAAMIARLGTIARFSQVLVDFESVSRRTRNPRRGERIDHPSWFYRRLLAYMQYYAIGAYEAFLGEESYDYDAVDITTVHQSKGLEWPIVFLSCLTAQRFPSSLTGARREWLVPTTMFNRARYEGSDVDERRLFYVALTRARETLYLSHFEKLTRPVKPSPYFEEVRQSIA
jgi:DNA helicase-2/ATP-dependent DNA helicase PcrA